MQDNQHTILIHGSYGNPQENWFPWLKGELENLGHKVDIPHFPTPENQNLTSWKQTFKTYQKYLTPNTILIGHSLGPAFILNLLEESTAPIKAAYFISPFISKLNNPDFDKINKTFTEKSFDWQKIKANCPNFYLYHADNDPYVSLEKAQEVADKLHTKVKIIPNAGHFNTASGYDKFEILLHDIKNRA